MANQSINDLPPIITFRKLLSPFKYCWNNTCDLGVAPIFFMSSSRANLGTSYLS